jgi:acetyltransferase-like isoleucine patch superfamily enzyme
MTNRGTAEAAIQGIGIGEGMIIGAGVVVIKDMPAGATVSGAAAMIVARRES